VLHNDGACRQLIAMTHVPELHGDQVTAPKLAVDAQVEQGQLTHSVLYLEPYSKRPDVLDLERGLLTNDLALFPRLATQGTGTGNGFQNDLQASYRASTVNPSRLNALASQQLDRQLRHVGNRT
jgi:hypothetical protein